MTSQPFNKNFYKFVPEFSGDILEFPSFIELFLSVVHTSDLNNGLKLEALRKKLKGRPFELVRTYNPSQYDQALKTLKAEYQNSSRVRLSLVQLVSELPNLRHREDIDTFEHLVGQLRMVKNLVVEFKFHSLFEHEICDRFYFKFPQRITDDFLRLSTSGSHKLEILLQQLEIHLEIARQRELASYYSCNSLVGTNSSSRYGSQVSNQSDIQSTFDNKSRSYQHHESLSLSSDSNNDSSDDDDSDDDTQLDNDCDDSENLNIPSDGSDSNVGDNESMSDDSQDKYYSLGCELQFRTPPKFLFDKFFSVHRVSIEPEQQVCESTESQSDLSSVPPALISNSLPISNESQINDNTVVVKSQSSKLPPINTKIQNEFSVEFVLIQIIASYAIILFVNILNRVYDYQLLFGRRPKEKVISCLTLETLQVHFSNYLCL